MIVPFNDLNKHHSFLEKEIEEAISRVIENSWFVEGLKSKTLKVHSLN